MPPKRRGRPSLTPASPKRPRAARGDAGVDEDFAALSEADRDRVLEKWRGLAGPAASVGAWRLQMLVAAIMHPKASEAAVRGGMARLRSWAGAGGLCAEALASTDPSTLEGLLEGVHWHRTKAQRIAGAAAVVAQRHGGYVPACREELLALPGVGPRLANVLAWVLDAAAPAALDAEEALDAAPPPTPPAGEPMAACAAWGAAGPTAAPA